MKIADRATHLKKTIRANREKVFDIIIAQLDPDAVGSAIGLRFLITELEPETHVRIFYCGYVGHPQNRHLFNRYNLGAVMSSISTYEPMGEKESCFVLVDSSSINDARIGNSINNFNPTIVIDHHRDSDITASDDKFIWIEEVGAASTLIIEALKALSISIPKNTHEIAGPLALGIYTDTKSLISGGARDRKAYEYIVRFTSVNELSSLINYSLPTSFYSNLKRALEQTTHDEGRLVTGVGLIMSEQGDDISTVADMFIRKEGVVLCVVWGIIGSKVRISARTSDAGIPLAEFLQKRFGETSGAKMAPDGHGEGGALLELELGFWSDPATSDAQITIVHEKIKQLVFSDDV